MSGNLSSSVDLDALKSCLDCVFNYTAVFVCYILLIPLFVYVLYLGCQRWRKQRSGSTSETSSHSDIITYNMVVMEMINIVGLCVYSFLIFSNSPIGFVASYLWYFLAPAEFLFHILTCVDRYLAIVHPVTYLRLKQSGGVRIRNISIGCVWLICFAAIGLVNKPVHYIVDIIFMLLSFITVCFCSLSVLYVLIRPGPGDVSRNRGRVDQSKKRAFQTITIILVTLVLRILSRAIYSALKYTTLSSVFEECTMEWSLAWFSVPGSLVLPLLFLHRVGKLPSCKTNTEPG